MKRLKGNIIDRENETENNRKITLIISQLVRNVFANIDILVSLSLPSS